MVKQPATIGSYRIVRQIGEGGMGAVYEAIHTAIERRVAIKVLKAEYTNNAELVARFFNEARAVNRVEHPSLVQISDYGQAADGMVYLVMEYLRGGMLRNRLDQFHAAKQCLPIDQLLQIVWQIAEALAVTHAKGIIHRDLKPENIMLVPDPAVPGGERSKILDFGIAKLYSASQVLTSPSHLMGTPCYMSPEQCRGEPDIDGRTDVYALGIMIYEMLAGEPPFHGDSLASTLSQHLFKVPVPLAPRAPQAPSALVEFVHRMLVKEPVHRPTMADTESALRRMLARQRNAQPDAETLLTIATTADRSSGSTTHANSTPPHTSGQYVEKHQRPRWLGVAVGGVAACAIVLVILLRLSSSGHKVHVLTEIPTPASKNRPAVTLRTDDATPKAGVLPKLPAVPLPEISPVVSPPIPETVVRQPEASSLPKEAEPHKEPEARSDPPASPAPEPVASKASPVRSAPVKLRSPKPTISPPAPIQPAKVKIYGID